MTRRTPAVLALLLAASLAGCSEDDPGRVPEAAAPWNPCDGLSARAVSAVLDQQLRKVTGIDAGPADDASDEADGEASSEAGGGAAAASRCALVPVREGEATFDVSYLLFDGGLDAAWATLGDDLAAETADGAGGGARVTRPRVPGAEAARLVVATTPKAALVTGFVENGDLIQTVNAADLAPYDADALVRATRLLLGQLSAHAVDAGVS